MVVRIPCRSSKGAKEFDAEYVIDEELLAQFATAYPHLNVERVLAKAALVARQGKGYTKRGMTRYLRDFLVREGKPRKLNPHAAESHVTQQAKAFDKEVFG